MYKNKVVFILTGSSARKLKRGGANLLGARAIFKNLHPFHHSELELNLLKVVQFGSLSSVYFEDKDIAISTLDTYVATYLREEVQQESLVRGIDRFSHFLELAAQLNGEPVNFSKLGRQLKIARKLHKNILIF